MKNWIIVGLAVALVAVSVGAGVLAQASRTANVEVRVWEDVNDPERNYISARPEGGSWRTLGTIPLPLTDGVSSSGRFRYGNITLAVPLPEQTVAPTVTPIPSPTATPSPTPMRDFYRDDNIIVHDVDCRRNLSWVDMKIEYTMLRNREGVSFAGHIIVGGKNLFEDISNYDLRATGFYTSRITFFNAPVGTITKCSIDELRYFIVR